MIRKMRVDVESNCWPVNKWKREKNKPKHIESKTYFICIINETTVPNHVMQRPENQRTNHLIGFDSFWSHQYKIYFREYF